MILVITTISLSTTRWFGVVGNELALFFSFISLVLTALAFLITYQQFLAYKEFIDPMFPKQKSVNNIATFSPKKEKKITIIFSAHHDSAKEFRLLFWFKRFYVVFVLASFLVLFMVLFISGWNLLSDVLILAPITSDVSWMLNVSNILLIIVFCLLPIALFMFWFTGDNVVPGARDCLAGCVSVLGIAEWVAKNRPYHVEVKAVTFGSEEAGLRGSKRFVARHIDELKNATYNLNFDGVGRHGMCSIVRNELTTNTRHDPKWLSVVKKAALDLEIEGMDVELEDDPWGGGGTDSVSFTRAGIPSTTIHMFRPLSEHLTDYHTRRDRIHFVDADAIRDCVDIGISLLFRLDGELRENA